jgi:hypothetical protein
MGELLATIIIPPLVGLVCYAVLHLFWKKQEEEADRIEQQHQLERLRLPDEAPSSKMICL